MEAREVDEGQGERKGEGGGVLFFCAELGGLEWRGGGGRLVGHF